MDLGKAALVIIITLILVGILNVALYLSLRGGSTIKQIELLRRVSDRVRRPWQDEDEKIDELTRRVAKFKRDEHIESDEELDSNP